MNLRKTLKKEKGEMIMTPEKTSPAKLMAILAFCAAIVGCVGFFLPVFSFNFFASVDYTGMDLIEWMGDDGYGMIVAAVGAGAAALFGLIALSNAKMLGITAGSAIVALCGILYTFISEEMMEYAAIGFWLFVIMFAVCAIIAFMGMSKAKEE